jgi:hypothetical protein
MTGVAATTTAAATTPAAAAVKGLVVAFMVHRLCCREQSGSALADLRKT